MEQKDISTLSVQELEALGYRTLRELEIQKRNIEVIERLIQEKSQTQKEDVKNESEE